MEVDCPFPKMRSRELVSELESQRAICKDVVHREKGADSAWLISRSQLVHRIMRRHAPFGSARAPKSRSAVGGRRRSRT